MPANRVDKEALEMRPNIPWAKMEGSAEALHWNKRDVHTLDMAMKVASGKDEVVQAGGNLGIFPKYLSYFFKKVYTFEPSPTLFPVMCRNAPEKNIQKFNVALGYERTPVAVSQTRRTKTHMPAHEGITHVSGPGDIPVMRIDDLELKSCNLICLDLEGYEPFALLGAVSTLGRCRPVLLIEVNNNAGHYGYDRDSVRRLIKTFGYRLVGRMKSDELYVPEEE